MPGPTYVFVLYVSEHTSRSVELEQSVRRICDEKLTGNYSLETRSVSGFASLDPEDPILVTPTLVRFSPGPRRQYVGDFVNDSNVVAQLCFGD